MPVMVKEKKPRKKQSKEVWQDDFLFDAYALAKTGSANMEIAKACGVSHVTFIQWVKSKPLLKMALEKARSMPSGKAQTVFREYVYRQLPDDIKEVWNQINQCETESNGYTRVKSLVDNQGMHIRQHLYFYALVDSNFNSSEACRKLCIPLSTVNKWALDDPDFAKLMDEVHIHKKNFFEGALIGLAHKGSESAILFANRTLNRDRGYNEKIEMNVTGGIQHKHELGIEDLDLPLETRKQIWDAMQKKQAELDRAKEMHVPGIPAIEDKREK